MAVDGPSVEPRLVTAAGEVLNRTGFVGTTLAEISVVSGIAERELVARYGDAESCCIACYDAAAYANLTNVTTAALAPGSWTEAAHHAARTSLWALQGGHRLMYAFQVVLTGGSARARAARRAQIRAYATLMQRWYAAQRRTVEGSPELPDEVFYATIAGIDDLVTGRIEEGRVETLHELEGPILYALLSSVGLRVAATKALHTAREHTLRPASEPTVP